MMNLCFAECGRWTVWTRRTPGWREEFAVSASRLQSILRPAPSETAEDRPPASGLPSPRLIPCLVILLTWILLAASASAAAPVFRLMNADSSGASLLQNGGFEQAEAGKAAHWDPAPQGCRVAPGEGRAGSQALCGENPTGKGWVGASQTLNLRRTNLAPLIVRGWSKAENVTGAADSDYSLYADLVYTDGTSLWGQTADFRAGSHDWEPRQVIILPEKPVQTLTLHCLFRNHSGKVWFDDVEVEEVQAGAGAVIFQGVPVALATESPAAQGPEIQCRTRDGLEATLGGDRVVSLRVDGRELAARVPSGFLARDVAANSDVFPFEAGDCPELGLKVTASYRALEDHVVVEGKVTDTRGQDRAVTLLFALPINAAGWRWDDDIRRGRTIEGTGEYANTVPVQCGATGTMSLYPVAAIHDGRSGLALAIDMAHPAQYRLVCHAGTKQFFIAYDWGIVPDTERFPRAAEFRFVFYRFDPQWGFRAAFQKLRQIFPDYFRVRSRGQGLWMPFTDISTVRGWEDFGFKYHEGDNNVAWDDAHGVLSFRYTEPMTWWMRMENGKPRTMAEALRTRAELVRSGRGNERQMARVSEVAGMLDSGGEPSLLFRNEPWCDGAIWSLNPNPALPAGGANTGEAATNSPADNGATIYWNDAVKARLYGPGAKGQLAGEYLDSLEGYVTANLNYRREHFRYSTVPLSFAADTRRPALFKGLAVFEFTRWFCEDVHRLGKLTFANGVPYRFTFLCPWLDVLGTETDWLSGGQYRPVSDPQMSLWRTMAGGKPYLLLMNTDYDAFTPDLVERYFQRSLFYGMWPGMFSHNAADHPYWQNPKWYDRDRPLFKKYLPLVKRVAEAGWQPVTQAACDNAKIWVERFGPGTEGPVYFTLFNDTAQRQEGRFRLEAGSRIAGHELVSGAAVEEAGSLPVALEPQAVRVLELRR